MTIHIPSGYSNGHFRFVLAGDPQEMTTSIGFSSAPGETPEDEAAIFRAAMSASTLLNAGSILVDYTYTGVRVERMTDTGLIVSEINTPIVGTQAGGCLPNNCSFLMDKVTNSGGREFRGRMFWPPMFVNEANVDKNGFISSVSAASLTTSAQTWRAGMVSNGIPPVLFHSNPALTPTLITSFRFQQQIATQRERMR